MVVVFQYSKCQQNKSQNRIAIHGTGEMALPEDLIVRWHTTAYNPTSRESHVLFLPLKVPSHTTYVYINTCK